MAARVGKYLLFETLGEGAFGKYVFDAGSRVEDARLLSFLRAGERGGIGGGVGGELSGAVG